MSTYVQSLEIVLSFQSISYMIQFFGKLIIVCNNNSELTATQLYRLRHLHYPPRQLNLPPLQVNNPPLHQMNMMAIRGKKGHYSSQYLQAEQAEVRLQPHPICIGVLL